MFKHKIDDDFQSYLTEGATFVGEPGIPMMMDLKNTQIPKGLVPINKIKYEKNKNKYVHCYVHDEVFSNFIAKTWRYIDILKQYDGVISPDCSMLIGQSQCLQQANVYFNRAVGFYLQKNGIPVIPNVRWSDESSFEYCFLGIPKNNIIAMSTHGCIKSKEQKRLFKEGLKRAIKELQPYAIVLHGFMPKEVFQDFYSIVPFYRFPSEFEETHKKEV